MAIHLDYNSDLGILRAKVKKFDIDEYFKALKQVTSEEHYPATVPTIWDLRELDFSDLDKNLAYFVAEIRSSFKLRSNANIAYVVSTPIAYGMMRMFQVLTDTEESSLVSYDYDEAEKWMKQIVRQTHT